MGIDDSVAYILMRELSVYEHALIASAAKVIDSLLLFGPQDEERTAAAGVPAGLSSCGVKRKSSHRFVEVDMVSRATMDPRTVKLLAMIILPSTCKRSIGFVVPIPTLPLV